MLLYGPAESASVPTLCLLLLFSSAVTHTPAVLRRLLWDATAAQLSLSLSLRSHFPSPNRSHFPRSNLSAAFSSSRPSSLYRSDERQRTARSACFLSCFLFPCLPSTKIKKGWSDNEMRNSLSSFKSKSALPTHIALILFPFPGFNFSVSHSPAVCPSVEEH